MGEELSKRLLGPYHESGEEQDASESDGEVVRCRGITAAGTRCSLTDERGPEGWYYKAGHCVRARTIVGTTVRKGRRLLTIVAYSGHHSSQGKAPTNYRCV